MPSALSCLIELADLRRLGRPQRRGRLVHDQDLGVEMDRAGDGDRLALAAGERDHRLLEAAEIGIEPPHHLARLRLHRGVVERSPAGPAVRGRDRGSTPRRRCRRAPAPGRPSRCRNSWRRAGLLIVASWPLMKMCPPVALVGARQHLDQAGLAGAVVAEQADDFAGIEIDRGVVDRLQAAEGERDVLHLDEGGSGLSVHGLIPWRFCGGRRCRCRPRRPARRRPPSAGRPSRSRAAPCPTAATG